MLTNFDIEELCDRLDLNLVGIVNKDRLDTLDKTIGSYYINLQDFDAGDGTHWVYARLYTDDDSDDENEYSVVKCLYFDPFGLDMPTDVSEYFKEFKPIPFNNRQIQNIRSSQCGWYCVCCDYDLTHKRVNDNLLDDYQDFINLWSSNPEDNLELLKKYFKPL